MRNKQIRRIFSFLLVVALLVSNMTFGFAKEEETTRVDNQIPSIASVLEENRIEVKVKKDQDQSIRVIVELEGEPIIHYAKKKGLKVNELDASYVENLTTQLVDIQKAVKSEISKQEIAISYHNEFVNVFNGFSGTTTIEEAKKIEQMPNVKRVVIANAYDRPDPEILSNVNMVNAPKTWDLGYQGEGMVVAIVDTGIDPGHKDFVLSEDTMPKLDQQKISNIVGTYGLQGKYHSEKVPYGYNYMDHNQTVKGSHPHGMHVAGIVAANGTADNNGIKGVAPEAQVLAMKVFGDDPLFGGTYGDIIVKAIDDAVILGADVINMSLGSDAAFVDKESPELLAVKRAADNGVICSISAGNANRVGEMTEEPFTFASNPDIGTLGAPGLAPESIQVASVENTHVIQDNIVAYNGEKLIYWVIGEINPKEAIGDQELEVVDVGDGTEEVDVEGKVALLKLGEYETTMVINELEAKGAIAIILYATDEAFYISYPYGTTIPVVFVEEGSKIQEGLPINNKIKFLLERVEVENIFGGEISPFTSWGTTPSLDFKPEITAPGGGIYSTINDNQYGNMSGTSMAAPSVSGGLAIVLQNLDEKMGLEGRERVDMAKNMIMNTAIPIKDKGPKNVEANWDNYVSPRRQGAGVMNVLGAVKTPVYIVDPSTGSAKVNLKEIKGDIAEFTVSLKNITTSQAVTYDIQGTVTTNYAFENEAGIIVNGDEAQGIYKTNTNEYPITISSNIVDSDNDGIYEVTVGPNDTVAINIAIDLSNVKTANGFQLNELFENGCFVEGFITFVDRKGVAPRLNIPYMGFYGEWDQAPILDQTVYDDQSFYKLAALIDEQFIPLGAGETGFDKEKIAISPNQDQKRDTANMAISFLRNAREVEINLLDQKQQKLRTLYLGKDVRKNYEGFFMPFTLFEEGAWDGRVNNEIVKDGTYYYEVKAKIDDPDARWQSFLLPIKVDTVAPTKIDFDYDEENLTVSVTGEDNEEGVGVYAYGLWNPVLKRYVLTSYDGKFDLSEIKESQVLQVVVEDYAGNMTFAEGTIEIKGEVPTNQGELRIILFSPEPLATYNTNQMTVEGFLSTDLEVEKLTINGDEVPLSDYNDFQGVITLDEGKQDIKVKAITTSGKEASITRSVFRDTQAPVIELDKDIASEVDSTVATVDLCATITDNFPNLQVKVNGNMEANIEENYIEFEQNIKPVTYNLEGNYPLNYGDNKFIIEAVDAAGTVTSEEINIHRRKPGTEPGPIKLDISKNNVEAISSLRPLKFKVSANKKVDFEVLIQNEKGKTIDRLYESSDQLEVVWAPEASKVLNGDYKAVIVATTDTTTAMKEVPFTIYNYPLRINGVNINQDGNFVTIEADIENLGPNDEAPMLVIQVKNKLTGWIVNQSSAKLESLEPNEKAKLTSGFEINLFGKYVVDISIWDNWKDQKDLAMPVQEEFKKGF